MIRLSGRSALDSVQFPMPREERSSTLGIAVRGGPYGDLREATERYEQARDRVVVSTTALVLGLVIVAVLRVRARRRQHPTATHSQGSPFLHQATSNISGLIGAGLALYCLWKQFLSEGEKPAPQLMFFSLALFYLAGYLGKQARRIEAGSRGSAEVSPGPGTPFALYLRGFADEDRPAQPKGMLGMLTDPTSVEEAFLGKIGERLQVIALKNVARRGLPSPYGTPAVDADHWKERVTALVAGAHLIVVQVGTTPGLAWELAELVRADALRRSVFVLPPGTSGQQKARWEAMLGVRHDGALVFSEPLSGALRSILSAWPTDDGGESACALTIGDQMLPVRHTDMAGTIGYEGLAGTILRVLSPREPQDVGAR